MFTACLSLALRCGLHRQVSLPPCCVGPRLIVTHWQTSKVHVQERGVSQLAKVLSALAKHPSHQQWNVSMRGVVFDLLVRDFIIHTFHASVVYRCLVGLLPSLLDLLACAPWTSLPGCFSRPYVVHFRGASILCCMLLAKRFASAKCGSVLHSRSRAARRGAKHLRTLLASKTLGRSTCCCSKYLCCLLLAHFLGRRSSVPLAMATGSTALSCSFRGHVLPFFNTRRYPCHFVS